MTKDQLKTILNNLYTYSQKAIEENEIPVAACLVIEDKVFYSFNHVEKKNNPFSHAEIEVIEEALKNTNSRYLKNSTLIVTLEPCLMCMGAILSARISKIVFGAFDNRFGTRQFAGLYNFNHKCEIVGGVLEEECSKILSEFFKKLR